jgi:hypothetical protein
MKTKLIILLVCAAIVPRSSALPVCLWDEVIDNWFSSPEIDCSPQISQAKQIAKPSGDDSADEIRLELAQQQSLSNQTGASNRPLSHQPIPAPLDFAISLASVIPDDAMASRDSCLGARPPPFALRASFNLPLLV